MNSYNIFFLLVLIMCVLGCVQQGEKAKSGYNKLVWSDEFNGSELPDSSKWSYDTARGCPDRCGWGNNELQYYTANSNNARVEGGNLIIEARKEKMVDAEYTSARLVSRQKGDWKYGRFEVRALIPIGKGLWPGIWMLPTDNEYGRWPHSGEIDIMENVGYMPDSIFGTVHTGAYNGMIGTQKSNGLKRTDLSSAYHTYAVEWTENNISFFVDNEKYGDFKNEKATSEEWPYDKRFHFLLNVAVGGNWGGKFGVDDSVFPQKMKIDYVRVYQ